MTLSSHGLSLSLRSRAGMEMQVRPHRGESGDLRALPPRNTWLWVGGSKTESSWAGFWVLLWGHLPVPPPAAPDGGALSNPLFVPSRLLQLQAQDRPRQAQAVSWWRSALPWGAAADTDVPGGVRGSFPPPWTARAVCANPCRVCSSLFISSSGFLRDLHCVQCRGAAHAEGRSPTEGTES